MPTDKKPESVHVVMAFSSWDVTVATSTLTLATPTENKDPEGEYRMFYRAARIALPIPSWERAR